MVKVKPIAICCGSCGISLLQTSFFNIFYCNIHVRYYWHGICMVSQIYVKIKSLHTWHINNVF